MHTLPATYHHHHSQYNLNHHCQVAPESSFNYNVIALVLINFFVNIL